MARVNGRQAKKRAQFYGVMAVAMALGLHPNIQLAIFCPLQRESILCFVTVYGCTVNARC